MTPTELNRSIALQRLTKSELIKVYEEALRLRGSRLVFGDPRRWRKDEIAHEIVELERQS
mgnify:CR=1 FL=1